jgi:NTP pyrophosphatase (non-canonical NTP hydrolase)
MSIQEYQKTVDNWIKEIGVRYFDEMTNTLLLNEEVGEFSRLIARIYGEQSFKKPLTEKDQKQQLSDEIADIFFVLTCLSNQLDINLEEAFKANIEKKTKRDIDRHKNNDKLK